MQEQTRTALFLDDEAYRTRLYRKNLALAGWEVIFCSTTAEANEILHAEDPPKFQLAVVDLQMGEDEMDEEAWAEFAHLPGLWFISRKARYFANQNTAVAILTNKSITDTSKTEDEAVGLVDLITDRIVTPHTDLRIGFYRKTTTPARAFPSRIEDLFGQPKGQLFIGADG